MHRQSDMSDGRLPPDLEASRDRGEPNVLMDLRSRSFTGEHASVGPPQSPWAASFTGFTQDDDQQLRRFPAAAAASLRNHHAWMLAHTRPSHDYDHHRQNARDVISTHDSQRQEGPDGSNNGDTRRSQIPWRELEGITATEPWPLPTFRHPILAVDVDRSADSLPRNSRYFADYGAVNLPVDASQATSASQGHFWPRRSNELFSASNVSLLNEANVYEDESEENNENEDGSEADEDEDMEASTASSVPKASRYLREMDRRVILERLAHGEKQAALAKEFHVSRAAVCNLFKHRHEILARTDENPFAKHPKKKKKKAKVSKPPSAKRGRAEIESTSTARSPHASSTGATSVSSSPRTSISSRSGPNAPPFSRSPVGTLHVIKSAALPLLLSAISDRGRSLADFRRNSERVFWLVLEEALALVPAREVRLELQETGQADVRYEIESPPCAISMEQQTANATPLLDIFQLMEPQQPSGFATVTNHQDALTVEITAGGGLPHSLRAYNVFLLNVVAASGEVVCAAIERLVREFDVAEANVSVVALFTSSEVVAMVQCKYPSAKIVTARIDSSITRRRIASTPVDLIVHRVRTAYGGPSIHTTRIGARA